MRDYLSPERERAALVIIEAQRDFAMPDSRAKVCGTMAAVPAMQRLTEVFRAKAAPIFHFVRLYRCDGSNVDLCHRASIEEGQRVVMPGTLGAELVDALKPNPALRLDSETLLSGQPQPIGEREWILYKPRSSAFYQTSFEEQLRALGVTTLVVCGCNLPNGPRATVYAGSNRDFRIVLVTDAISGATDVGLTELAQMGVYLMTSEQCLAWMMRDGKAAA
jgi:nicotinamidase-related amidase